MKNFAFLFATILLIGLAAQLSFAQNTAEAKERNKELFIKITRFLEESPFDEQAKQSRENAFAFLVETEDVSVTICTELVKEATKKKNKYAGELLIQYSIGVAAFKLEFPERKDDENAAQLAGLESMIKSYQAMVAVRDNAKFKGMDDLIAKRDAGELSQFVVDANCGK